MTNINKIASGLKQALVQIETFAALFSLSTLLILILIQLVARNFFDYGFPVLDIIARHLVLFILFMGAALASENNKHIKIDILNTLLNDQQRNIITPILLGLTAVICFIFSWYSAAFWLDELEFSPANEKTSLYLSIILPLGFIILGIHFLLLSITGYTQNDKLMSSN